MKHTDAVVIGQNYSTSLGLIQAVGEAGYNVGVVHNSVYVPKSPSPEMLSKYVVKAIAISREDPTFLSQLIECFSHDSEKVVLLPADDYSVAFIDNNLSVLDDFFYVPSIAHEEGRMSQCMDKEFQSKLSESVGIPTARNWSVELNGSLFFTIPDDIIYPCIIKPQRSIGASKNLIQICNNRDELNKTLSKICIQNPCTILIEEYIQVDKEYTVPCIALREEVFIPAFLRKEKIGEGTHRGVTISGKVIDSSHFSSITEKLTIFIKNTKIEGIVDVELLQCGETFFFNELNLRYGAAGYVLTRAGINMPEMWIKYCLGDTISFSGTRLIDGLSFVSDKAAIESFGAGYITWHEYQRLLASADFRFLINNPDSSASKAFKKIVLKTVIKRILKSLKTPLR